MRHTLIQLPKGELLDPFDPNNWVDDDYEHRIYGCADLSVYAVVDAIDYPYLSQFKWSLHKSKRQDYPYLRRGISEFYAPDSERYESPITGLLVRNRNRWQSTRFLHTDVMLRKGTPQPTPKHNEVDHLNRKIWDCRRDNLDWATRAMQIANSKWNPQMRAAK